MPIRLRDRLRPRVLLRLLLLGLALACIYLGGESLAFLFRQRAANAAVAHMHLALVPAPTEATRLMVFAPHCDDETLGCGGLIQQTLAAGGSARVVILTNGDGFRTAVARQVRSLRVGPSDYIQFAALRQQETTRALGSLGLKREDVLFLGYPDRGLMPLWNDDWKPGHPYTSTYTRYNHSPYANTFDPSADYCGQDLLNDIETVLRAYHPTLVTVTHPAEDHPDHGAAAAFVARALAELQSDPKDGSWAHRMRLQYYLVHRGDWPQPQGEHLHDLLLPPAEMAYLDTTWRILPLTAQQTARKEHAIELYPSQMALMGRFLSSFSRRNELFGQIMPPHLSTVPDGTMHTDASPTDWEAQTPVLLDPARDNVLRDLQGGGDIRALYACRDSHTLYLRLDTRQPISSRMVYTLHLRAFGPQGETSQRAYMVRLHADDHTLAGGIRAASRGRILEVAVPWEDLTHQENVAMVRALAVSAATSLEGVEIDKTGVRFLTL